MSGKTQRASLFIKHRICGTPLEKPLDAFRSFRRWHRLSEHPGLSEVASEDVAIYHFIKSTIKSDWNCIDVGAHIGSFTSKIVQLAPNGTHFALEALSYKASWIAKRWTKVEVLAFAAGDSSKDVIFFENETRPGFSSLGRRGNTRDKKDRLKELKVKMITLDEALPNDLRVNFIKIDVEGAELGVVQGASGMISRCMPIVLFESGPGGAESCGYHRLDLFDFFKQFGYEIYLPRHALYKREPLTRQDFDLSHRYPFRAFNYFAIPSEVERDSDEVSGTKGIGEKREN